MRLIIKLFLFMCLVPVGVFGQDMIRKVMVGPYEGDVRILVAYIQPTKTEYKIQSMIIDVKIDKKKKQVKSFFVDLTTTVRSLSTGKKKQNIFQFSSDKKGKLKLRCDGKFKSKDNNSAIDKIVEVVKTVIGSFPLDSEKPTGVTLSQDIEEKILSVMDSLETEDIPCLRKP